MNQLKPKEVKSPKIAKSRKGKNSWSFLEIINGNILSREGAVSTLPFVFFLTLICICYIGNGYYAEDTVRAINSIGSELKELKTEYIITKSDLMFNSKQSQVAKAMEMHGVKESVVPPKKIVLKK